MFDLTKLREIRRKKGITQEQLAAMAGVSQSLIARIESGTIDPCFSKVMRIMNSLEQTQKGNIEEIMTKKIISVKPDTEIRKAIKIMQKKGISQLPVMENDKIIGSVTETGASMVIQKPWLKYVKDILEPSLPILDKHTSIQLCNEMLKYTPAIIITNSGKPCGIVTKSNILRLV